MSGHNTFYKNDGKRIENLRRDRINSTLSLRKKRREQIMDNRRISYEGSFDQALNLNQMNIDEIVTNIQSLNITVKIQAITQLSTILSSTQNPPIDDLIRRGILTVLSDYLQTKNETLQHQSIGALANITCGTNSRALIESNVVPQLLSVFSSTNMEICEQAILVTGNIVSKGSEYRDHCINSGLLPALIKFIQPNVPPSFLENIVWILFNVCRDKKCPPSREVLDQILPELFKLIHHEDEKILETTVQTLYHISEYEDDCTQKIIDSGVVPQLVQLLVHQNTRLLNTTIGTLGNITAGTDEQTQFVLECGVLEKILPLLVHERAKINKSAVWLLSNVAAGTDQQRLAIIESGVIPSIVLLLDEGEFITQREAIFLIANMTELGNPDQILFLAASGILIPLCNFFDFCYNVEIIQMALQILLDTLRKLPDYANEIIEEIEKVGASGKIERLQNHKNEEVCQNAYTIIQDFYSVNEDNSL